MFVNIQKYTVQPQEQIIVPTDLEALWLLIQPKDPLPGQISQYYVCAFYSPPSIPAMSKKGTATMKSNPNRKLIRHIGDNMIKIITADKDAAYLSMCDVNVMPVNELKARLPGSFQMVSVATRVGGDKTLDIILTNIANEYEELEAYDPIKIDDAAKGKDSDHLFIVATPKTPMNQCNLANPRVTIVTQPIPQEMRDAFGVYIGNTTWSDIVDKAWMTAKMKDLEKEKKAQYSKYKKNKPNNYLDLDKEFKQKVGDAKREYMTKQVIATRTLTPAASEKALKELMKSPGYNSNNHGFTLSEHLEQGLTNLQQANAFLMYFSAVLQQFLPYNTQSLRPDIQKKIVEGEGLDLAPVVSSVMMAKCSKMGKEGSSTVPGELHHKLRTDHLVLFAEPCAIIATSVIRTGQWPEQYLTDLQHPYKKTKNPHQSHVLTHA